MLFEKKKERRENTGDIVIPGMDGEKKAGGCCFRKSSSFRMVAQGRKRGRERERERGKRPRFWVTRPRVIPVTESACVKRCPIARSAQPFRPDGNHLPRDYHAYTHCSIFLEEGWWWWSLGRRLVDCKNCYFFSFLLFFFFLPSSGNLTILSSSVFEQLSFEIAFSPRSDRFDGGWKRGNWRELKFGGRIEFRSGRYLRVHPRNRKLLLVVL